MKPRLIIAAILLLLSAPKAQAQYFPPGGNNGAWDTVSPASLGWCANGVDTLLAFLGRQHTKAFIILKGGKIIVEKYYGTFTQDSVWYWASAGKTLTAFLVGMAQGEGLLNINDSLPRYLGPGFSACTPAQEGAITIRHQLTMTTGFKDANGGSPHDNGCTADSCLIYLAPPGTRWAYHNAPYTILDEVMLGATGMNVTAYKAAKLTPLTGITGVYIKNSWDNVHYSKPRSFARFGLLVAAGGKWAGTQVIKDTAYFNAMLRPSQSINESYGYLWWLNGKASYRLPGPQLRYTGAICPHAPADMVAALGKNDQILNIVPSEDLVMIRMGEPMYTSTEVANASNDSIWVRLNAAMCRRTTGVAVSAPEQGFEIYPNPARGVLFIKRSGECTISIADPTGRVLLSQKGSGAMDISGLSPGVYFVWCKAANSTLTRRLVKQ